MVLYISHHAVNPSYPWPNPQQGTSSPVPPTYSNPYLRNLLWQLQQGRTSPTAAGYPWSSRIRYPNPQHPSMVPFLSPRLQYPTMTPHHHLKSYPVQPLHNTVYRRFFKRYCPGNRQALYLAKSQHSNRYQDRRWEFSCKTVTDVDFSHCYWTKYQNHFKMPLLAHCPSNYVMNGIQSYFRQRRYYDRKFRIRCCYAPSYKTKSCSLSGFVNRWDEKLDYSVSGSRVFTGVYSFYNSSKK